MAQWSKSPRPGVVADSESRGPIAQEAQPAEQSRNLALLFESRMVDQALPDLVVVGRTAAEAESADCRQARSDCPGLGLRNPGGRRAAEEAKRDPLKPLSKVMLVTDLDEFPSWSPPWFRAGDVDRPWS